MEKRIDESWKEQVEREKSKPSPPRPGGSAPVSSPSPPEAAGEEPSAGSSGFGTFLSSLSMQALMALGELAHPVTQERRQDLEQARYLIDILGILQAKTRGNLTAEESTLLEGLLYELRMKYVSASQERGR